MPMCDYCRHHDCQQPQWHIKAVLNNDMYCQAFKTWIKRHISMANVTASFVSENKNITRRHWADRHSRLFHIGSKALVWNKQARFGGEPIGVLELTENPFKQNTNKMYYPDYVNEGFKYLDGEYHRICDDTPLVIASESWRNSGDILTVVPFKILEVFPNCKEKYTSDEEIIRCVKALVKAIA